MDDHFLKLLEKQYDFLLTNAEEMGYTETSTKRVEIFEKIIERYKNELSEFRSSEDI